MFLPARPLHAAYRGARALLRPTTPLLAQLVVTRRCNLACGYCYEYDDRSTPVPISDLMRRVDRLGGFGTLVLTLTGGEPLLHPELDRVVARAVATGMVVTAISNAYPITREWIARLNDARLTLIQVSIDNLEPNTVSQKSWSRIESRLMLLREHARFAVNVNAVLGTCPPDEIRALARKVRDLGFFMTVGLLHDQHGRLDRGLAGDEFSALFRELRRQSRKSIFHRVGEGWEDELVKGGTAPYRCRAGARYLYVDEDGLVSYCSQRRGEPGVPLLEYGPRNRARAFATAKGCEASCAIACVRRASAFDRLRPQGRHAASLDPRRLPSQ